MNKTKSKSNNKVIINRIKFCVLSPFQRFIPISAFYPQFSVISPFQCFIPISAFYPHFSVLSPIQRFIPISVSVFSFRFSHSVSAFYPDPPYQGLSKNKAIHTHLTPVHVVLNTLNCKLTRRLLRRSLRLPRRKWAQS